MKISYRRTGGFAGMVMTFNLNTDTLPPEESQTLRDLVASADFFALPPKITSRGPGADQFQYSIMVETEEQQHTIEVNEGSIPENLRPLLNELRLLSRSTRSI
jgi:hypothetical protein